MKKCCSAIVITLTVFACILAVPKTDGKPESRPSIDHEVGSVWPDNIMIISSAIERSDAVESKMEMNVTTAELNIASADDDVTAIESNPTTNSSLKIDVIISTVENIETEQVTAESVPLADEAVEIVDQVKSISDKLTQIIDTSFKSDDDVINNGTFVRTVESNCVFNLAIPNRNIPSITYSTNCDFRSHDMYTLFCVPDAFTCASLCAGDSRCTHFTYHVSPLSGRSCQLKNAPGSGGSWASSVRAPSSYVCGYVGKRAFNNVLLGLCLSLDINVNI